VSIEVDLRAQWPVVRDQGNRQSCLACSTSDAHMLGHSLSNPLSAEFLYYHAAQRMPGKEFRGGLTFDAVDDALQVDGQPLESEWAYETSQPKNWIVPAVSKIWHATLGVMAGDQAVLLQGALTNSCPVVLGIRMTGEFMVVKKSPYIISANGQGFGAHAVLAVGLGNAAGYGTLVLIRNSWGTRWGDKGYAWLDHKYLSHNLIGTRTIVVK
jgi:hypothetical protein